MHSASSFFLSWLSAHPTGPLEGLKIRGEGAVSNKMLPLALVKIGLTDLPKNGVRVRGGGACAPRPNGSDRTECM